MSHNDIINDTWNIIYKIHVRNSRKKGNKKLIYEINNLTFFYISLLQKIS